MQAARGASLNPSEPASPQSSSGRPGLRQTFLLVALAAYAVDLTTKQLAVENLSGRGRVDLLGSWFGLHLTRNPGAAFSTGAEYTLLLSLLSIAAVCVVVFFARRLGSLWWAVGLGFLLGGVLGNLTDRVFRAPGPMRGHVVDFLELPNWPVFNVADVCINLAAVVIVVQAVRGIGLDGRKHD